MQQGAESEAVQASSSKFLFLSEFLSKIGSHLLASSGIMEKEHWHGILFKPNPSRPSDLIGL